MGANKSNIQSFKLFLLILVTNMNNILFFITSTYFSKVLRVLVLNLYKLKWNSLFSIRNFFLC